MLSANSLPRRWSAAGAAALRGLFFVLAAALCLTPNAAGAQAATLGIDSLLAQARRTSPALRAARARVDEARARVAPASTRPDPMLMAGVQNLPLSQTGFDDPMTMTMVGASQRFPWPGRLTLQRRIAEHQAGAAEAALEATWRDLQRDVRTLWYQLAYLETASEIVERNRRTLLATIAVTEARYTVGRGAQSEVLRARVEAARLGDGMSALLEERLATLARLNALLDRPGDAPTDRPAIPERILRAAIADSVRDIRFVSPSLGSRAADSPLPSVDRLQELALANSPQLGVTQAEIAAQTERARLAGREHLPEIDLSVTYGFRSGFPDMVTAVIALPLPVQRARRQGPQLAAERAALDAVTAQHDERLNMLRAEVAGFVSEAERARTRLAVYGRAVLPQARAVLESTLAAYETGREDLLPLLDSQSALFEHELAARRALADFAIAIAELERLTGTEVLP